MSEYKAKPSWRRCTICGEWLGADDKIVGGKVKHGGTRCAHKACWDREQAELSKKVKQ